MRGKTMTMTELIHRVHQLLEFNGFPVLWELPEGPSKPQADAYVKKQWAIYRDQIDKRDKRLPSA
jgi:hypothetical protein